MLGVLICITVIYVIGVGSVVQSSITMFNFSKKFNRNEQLTQNEQKKIEKECWWSGVFYIIIALAICFQLFKEYKLYFTNY